MVEKWGISEWTSYSTQTQEYKENQEDKKDKKDKKKPQIKIDSCKPLLHKSPSL